MTQLRYEIRPGAYYDSVVLMQLQQALAAMDGVKDAGVVMATEANVALLASSGLLPEDLRAKADDLLIVVQGDELSTLDAAISQVDQLLKRRRAQSSHDFRPRSLEAAAKSLPEAQWVLISVPGRYAAGVAREALRLKKHVFLYSDNVSLNEEVALKRTARDQGLMIMGPDCGTAIIGGTGLGFANRVRQGEIGLVGASGTGMQAITTEIHNLGGGISQAIGTGGRDLKEEVDAITAHQALELLAEDPNTSVIVLVSKPPSPPVATRLLRAAQHLKKPVVVNLIGYAVPGRRLGNLYFTTHLCDAAELAVRLVREGTRELSVARRPITGFVRGLFAGGTIAYEMLLGLQAVLAPIYSNVPIRPEQRLADVWDSREHTILDMGEDAFTQGRLHPMMDNNLRLRRFRQEIDDPDVGLILIDVVLGEGSHPDPAGDLAPAVAEAVKKDKRVVAIVIGTEEDPQDLNGQLETLMAAGATVFATTSEALDYVYNRVRPPEPQSKPKLALDAFQSPLAAINVGLESFYESLRAQGGSAIQLEWRPPAGGNEALMAILSKMKS